MMNIDDRRQAALDLKNKLQKEAGKLSEAEALATTIANFIEGMGRKGSRLELATCVVGQDSRHLTLFADDADSNLIIQMVENGLKARLSNVGDKLGELCERSADQ